MAAFLVRALGCADDGGGDLFEDDDGNIFESAIDKLATAGVTRGCNPAEGNTQVLSALLCHERADGGVPAPGAGVGNALCPTTSPMCRRVL